MTVDKNGEPMTAQETAKYWLSRPELVISRFAWTDLVSKLLKDSERLEEAYAREDALWKQKVKLERTLEEVRELIEGYVDADHNGMTHVPNKAMQAVTLIDEALGRTYAYDSPK